MATSNGDSQVEVTPEIEALASEVDSGQDLLTLVKLRDLLFETIDFIPYDPAHAKEHGFELWGRTASEILSDGFIYGNKGCTDTAILFIALCRAKGFESRFVKVVSDRGRNHSMAEVFVPPRWVLFDVAIRGSEPVYGEMTKDSKHGVWRLWRKGRDCWDTGLRTPADALKMNGLKTVWEEK